MERGSAAPVEVNGASILDPGAPIIWFVFPDAWADVGRFHRADGSFTGWYTNIRTPIVIAGNNWSSTDLFLDHWLPHEGRGSWLDQDELEAAVRATVIDHWTVERVAKERQRIEKLLAIGDWPPPVTREIDLAKIRTELQQ